MSSKTKFFRLEASYSGGKINGKATQPGEEYAKNKYHCWALCPTQQWSNITITIGLILGSGDFPAQRPTCKIWSFDSSDLRFFIDLDWIQTSFTNSRTQDGENWYRDMKFFGVFWIKAQGSTG